MCVQCEVTQFRFCKSNLYEIEDISDSIMDTGINQNSGHSSIASSLISMHVGDETDYR